MLLYSEHFLLAVIVMRRGQAFEVFRLLIAAVVAGAILMVLLQILGGFVTPTQDPQKVAAQFVKDLSTYGGVRVSDPITFKPDTTIDLAAVAREASLSADCVCPGKNETSGDFSMGRDYITYNGRSNYVARVKVACGENKCGGCKEIGCEISIIPRR